MTQRTKKMLKRWIAIDRDLHLGASRVPEFAECWFVDMKTVRRDLAMFKSLGFPAKLEKKKPEVNYFWRYAPDQKPMFTASEEARRKCEEYRRSRDARSASHQAENRPPTLADD